MSDAPFVGLDHDEALALLVMLRRGENELNDSLQTVLLKLERQLFAVHSIQEMEALIREIDDPGGDR